MKLKNKKWNLQIGSKIPRDVIAKPLPGFTNIQRVFLPADRSVVLGAV